MADSVSSVQCLPVCHLVLGDSWSNVWPTWTSESGWLGGVLQFVDFQRKIMGWFELLLLIELEYNNIVVSSILTLQHSLVSAGWSVSAYLANLVTGLIWLPKNMSDHIDLATQSFLRLASLPGVCCRVLMTPNGASWRRHTLLTKGRLYSSPCNSVQPVY